MESSDLAAKIALIGKSGVRWAKDEPGAGKFAAFDSALRVRLAL